MLFELNWQQLEPVPFLIVEKNVTFSSSVHLQFSPVCSFYYTFHNF